MAANKFAASLPRDTHKLAVILVYAVLEWTLIALLLLNGLFAYLIARFAAYFGLQAPCVFCSRVDHLFESADDGRRWRQGSACRDLVCPDHAAEISGLGYCDNHRRLAEVGEMCEDCCPTSSRPAGAPALLAWMKRSEEGEKDLRCSCCGVVLESGFFSPYFLFKQSWGLSEYGQTGIMVDHLEVDDQDVLEKDIALGEEKLEEVVDSSQAEIFPGEEEEEKNEEGEDGEHATAAILEEEEESSLIPDACHLVEDASIQVLTFIPGHICAKEDRLVPIELIDFMTEIPTVLVSEPDEVEQAAGANDVHSIVEKELGSSEVQRAQQHAMTLDIQGIPEEENALIPSKKMDETVEEKECSMTQGLTTETDDIPVQNSAVPHPSVISDQQVIAPQATTVVTLEGPSEEDLSGTKDSNSDISIGSEIGDKEHIECTHTYKPTLVSESTQDQDSVENDEKTTMDQETAANDNTNHISEFLENNEIEEDRAPETPTYTDGVQYMSRRFLIGRRESGTESLDGSVASEFEGCDTMNMDQLKAALQAERKALTALYVELEEERSAAAIAANQTMAMITRLQEEKAAMQMEALQYQRMMDEQSEYDQEALQLLNELMVKREKENEDLEKELEMYRKKLLHYETKERRQMGSNKVNGRHETPSASSSAEDIIADVSIESLEKDEFADNSERNHKNTPAGDVLSSGTDQATKMHLNALKESLADFEEERLSILEQLKELERKLLTMEDEDPQDSESMVHHMDGVVHDYENGFSDNSEDRKLDGEPKSMGSKGKRLLPLFDAVDGGLVDDAIDAAPEALSNRIEDPQKLAIMEEVDNLYERLDALQGDREFVKHCINSLKKGDKGIHLLQEILENLRDLRNVELRTTNSSNALALLST